MNLGKWNVRGAKNDSEEGRCILCGEKKDIVHFIVKCENLEKERDHNLLDAGVGDSEEKMRILLFRNERRQEIGKMIRTLWESRKKQLKEKEKNIITVNPLRKKVTTQGCKDIGKNERGKYTLQTNQIATQGFRNDRKGTLKKNPLATQGCRKSERIQNIYKKIYANSRYKQVKKKKT